MTEPTFTRLTPGVLRDLMVDPEPPCVTITLPTHRRIPDQLVDLPTYRGLVRRVADTLATTCAPADRSRLLEPLAALAHASDAWRSMHSGLAVLVDGRGPRGFRVDRPLDVAAAVGPRFAAGPLLRLATASDRCDLLALTSRRARVAAVTGWHDGRGTSLARIEPATIGEVDEVVREEAIDAVSVEPHRVRRGMGAAGRGTSVVVHGGFGARRDAVDADTEIFLRHVDVLVDERVSRRSGLPLLLVAQPRLAAVFRGLSRNPRLVPEGVPVDPHLLDEADLTTLVEPVFAAARDARIARLVGDLAAAIAHGRGCGNLITAAEAAAGGRAETLLIEVGRIVRGAIDRPTGSIRFDGRGEDLVTTVAEIVIEHGGDVAEVPRGILPTVSGVGAICRW